LISGSDRKGQVPNGGPVSHTSWVERKLATVLFVDLVDSTALVVGTDPEVARRHVTEFFALASKSIESHGGRVEKFAGDAVMAAFGVPRAHEDDAERALRAALEIRAAVRELGAACRIGVDAGEVVTEETESTFATGQAVNIAARLQQSAEPNEILVGAAAYRLAAHAVELEPAGERSLDGFSKAVPVWRAVCALERRGRRVGTKSVPLFGRDVELALLRNTFQRTVRDRRAHLVTIYGEPGIGKSRLARDFVGELEDATVLVGRCLPYGEGITYWPLAEMVKASAGISDDDPAEVARAKLLAECGDEAVAELLAIASGVVESLDGDRSQPEIAWAVRRWAERLAAVRPLVLGFDDIQWSEEPLLGLIEHLTSSVRDAPLLVLCLARPDLLDVYPAWGAGRVRGAMVELTGLAQPDAEALVDALLADATLSSDLKASVLDKTEGNPLFVEETVRMLAEGTDGRAPIPDTVQALIAARIDGLERPAKMLLQRSAVIGRVFWRGALHHLAGDIYDVDDVLEELVMRDFVTREPRSSISGEEAFRFKHILIREIAYSGLTKSARAELHAAFADWLHGRGVAELVEIRAYHLDHAVKLLAELDGAAPQELARAAASALEAAGTRAVAREANRSGRNLLLRALEIEPTLDRRYQAAKAAWRLNDIPAVAVEMERVRAEAHEVGNRSIEGRALITLGEVRAFRHSDAPGSRRLIEQGLGLLEPDDSIGRFDALRQLNTLARWVGDVAGSREYAEQAVDAARATGRKDLMSWAANLLATSYLWEYELDQAQEFAIEGGRLAEESGGIVPRGDSLNILANVASLRGNFESAIRLHEESIARFAEAGAALDQGRGLNHLADLLMTQGELAKSEQLARAAIRLLKPLGDRGYLCESQRILAELLVRRGKLEEAEHYALEAMQTVGPNDVTSLATTRMALGLVRVAQGREDEGEVLLREAVDRGFDHAPGWVRATTVTHLADFLEARGRHEEAAELESLSASPAGAH
jgi:class 3 adenylate cyclase/tetratricopeptide (TPR) repeat protein